MSLTGANNKFVNAQNFFLTNVTDLKNFQQISGVSFDINREVKRKSWQNATREKLYGVLDNAIEFDIVLTVPEVAYWVALTVLNAQNDLPEKTWRLSGISLDGASTFLMDIVGKVVSFVTIRREEGPGRQHVRIEASTITVTAT